MNSTELRGLADEMDRIKRTVSDATVEPTLNRGDLSIRVKWEHDAVDDERLDQFTDTYRRLKRQSTADELKPLLRQGMSLIDLYYDEGPTDD